MIEITDIGGSTVYVNSDMIEKIETVPDTILILQNGHRYIVREKPRDVIDRIISFRRRCTRLDSGSDY